MNDTTTAAPAADAPEYVIKLDPPLKLAEGVEYAELVLREPSVAQWTLYQNLTGVAADIVAVSAVSGIPQPAVEGMGMRLFGEAAAWLGRAVNGEDAGPFPKPPEGAREWAMPLRNPVEWAGVTYHELKLREPTAKEWREFDALGGAEGDVRAVSLASGVPELAIRKIGVRDLFAATRWIAGFFPNAPESGAA